MNLTLAHGFTQTAKSWDTIVELIDRPAWGLDRITTIDLPGHGEASAIHADLWGSANRLARLGGRGVYMGYSLGGRVALHTALAHPDIVDRLVLIGATAGITDEVERAQRRSLDDRLADHVEAVGVEQFIDEWLHNPLFAGLTEHTAQRADRLRNSAAGLASSLRNAGTGTQQPLWERLAMIDCPTLLIVGERDTKFVALADQMADLMPAATVEVIRGAGHSAHLESPAATVDAIDRWIRP